MRWKAYFFLNPDVTSRTKETFGFHSAKNLPPIDELKGFEDDMLKMIQSIQFRKINNPFLLKLKNDIDRIENESKLLIPADKTTNIYKLETPVYNELLERNVTKSYKKSQQTTIQTIQAIDNAITSKLGIDNRVDITAKKEAFTTLKHQKPKFENRPTCRLINPTKSE